MKIVRVNIDVAKILKEIKILPKYDESIALQTVNGIDHPFYGISNQIRIDKEDRKKLSKLHQENNWGSNWKEQHWDTMTELLFDIPYTNGIIQKLNLKRARLMRVPPKSCYEWHKDMAHRIHIPLITNDKCFFVVEDDIYRLSAHGSAYLIDTTKYHTFVNASLEDRLHLVGMIEI